ncbi:SCP2 sterol-binding domain-containing protein [Sphingomonas jatrophae]|uniref:Putative sterol carrier protein n=1 Tax=Sphingomonas jatrophae TaxID=1166337 RepID=A0A1I6LA13_9SPHN|nr:SCP2 sterol-binding domain-containing protein [Sphingomonas jatrophae]SFS00297.1 Putative sterol carrier protein [Sphingomonas jatrophae]
MTKSDLAEKLRQANATLPGKVVRLDFGPDGSVTLDGNSQTILEDDTGAASDATVNISWDDFKSLAKGQLNPMTAFMSGKIRLDGDMGVAMQLQSVFSKLQG